jgi:O-acetyl-ADP-ribose deacetylase (regulator of RNase III)
LPHISILDTGNLFDSGCDLLVCPVNTYGALGKGLALEFKHRFPAMTATYATLCRHRELLPGDVYVTVDGEQRIALAATKDHWRDPSRLVWVEHIVAELVVYANTVKSIQSMAIPAIGSGLGQLSWPDVQPVILSALQGITRPDFEVKLYAPQ